MLAVSWGRPEDRPTPLEAAEELMGPAAARVVMSGVGWRCVVTEVSRLDRVEPSSGRLTVQRVRGGRLSGRDVHTEDVERWLAGPALARHDDMDQLLPPYAAVH